MNSYAHRLLLTTWRKKSTVLVCVALITLLIFGLQYTQSNLSNNEKGDSSQALTAELTQSDKANVRFVDSQNKKTSAEKTNSINEQLSDMEQLSQDENAAKKFAEEDGYTVDREVEQQLGIPFVNLDLKNPFIPKHRIVHFDLKGAPLLVSFYKRIFPIIKTLGATGILMGNIINFIHFRRNNFCFLFFSNRIRGYVSLRWNFEEYTSKKCILFRAS